MNMNTIIEYPEDDNGPKAYLMWDIVGASIIARVPFECEPDDYNRRRPHSSRSS